MAGGTGRLGRELVGRLAGAGHTVRVLTRNANHADGLPVEVCVGDVGDPAAVGAAVQGCSTVISAVHGFTGGRGSGPDAVDRLGNHHLIRAAVEAGVEHFVLVSVHDARPDHPMSLHRAKFAAEQDLRPSGLAWTILRPAAYLETWLEVLGGKPGSGGPALVFGRGTNPINFVSVRDVSTVVDRVVHEPTHGEVIDVGGPQDLTMVEFTRLLGAHKIRRIPRTALRVLSVAARPVAPSFARQAAAAVVMDTADMTCDATTTRARFPDVEWHRLADLVAGP
ncbi:SDR family oxidoreductase [Labedaea rhizosphaerae]|uniref:SDR family oxidoreductase n=1 Tax=Labedaea rhizosphaerae TaxID=598644 RepID=UPI001414EA8D|nr:SDR family oxidoreductase [Labedaea rhizosphaerae]